VGQRQKIGYQHWNTPPEILAPLQAFRPITLDPCSNVHSVVPAQVRIAEAEGDGLTVPWHHYGHTFVNPPYANQPAWIYKACEEHAQGAPHITMLIPAATETGAFQSLVFGFAQAVCFLSRRVAFLREGKRNEGGNTLPSVIAYWGEDPAGFARAMAPIGVTATQWRKGVAK
jgi:hypothetical protein